MESHRKSRRSSGKGTKRKTSTKIATQIALRVGLMALMIGVLIGGLSLYQSQSAIKAQVDEELSKLTISGAQKASTLIKMRLGILQELANREEVKNGNFEEKKASLIKEVEEKSYLDMAIVDTSGSAKYLIEDTTADLADREYVQKALAGEANVSNVLISKVTGKAVLMYAVPIWNIDETKVVGALIARKDGNALYEAVKDSSYGKSGYAYVIDLTGVIVAHPNEEYVQTQFSPIIAAKTDSTYESGAIAFEKMIASKQGVDQYVSSGNPVFNSYTQIEGTEWILVSTAYESEVFERLNILIRQLLITTGVIVLFSFGLAYLMGKNIAAPIVSLTQVFLKRARLDFTIEEEHRGPKKKQNEIDEMHQASLVMTANIREFIAGVSKTAETVSATSQELSATAEQSAQTSEEVAVSVDRIARGAVQQADSTNEAQGAIERLSEQIEENRQGTTVLFEATEHMNQSVLHGDETIDQLLKMNQRNKTATAIAYESVIKTRESTDKIVEATNMIMNIASQTNLLALNASIEAARAGEQGKGFAVVADEIRKLAEESRTMTEKIETTVKELMGDAKITVEKMQETNQVVSEQEETVKNTKQAFEDIGEEINHSKRSVEQILQSAKQMRAEKEMVQKGLSCLAKIALENAASTQEVSASVEEHTAASEEISTASEELSRMATDLQEMILKFKLE